MYWVGRTHRGPIHIFDDPFAGLPTPLPFPAFQKAEIPVIFLLSVGADPTESIEVLARRKKVNLAIDRFASTFLGLERVVVFAQGCFGRKIFRLKNS